MVICLIKTFLLSQFVYAMQALTAPRDKENTLLFRFQWKNKNTNTKASEKAMSGELKVRLSSLKKQIIVC